MRRPGRIAPPRIRRSASTNSRLIAVPKSTQSAGRGPEKIRAAAFANRSAPNVSGCIIRERSTGQPRIRELIHEHLQYAGYICEEAGDGSAALAQLSGGGFDLVILDLMMPFMDGMTCLREMRARHINTPVIILTARGEEYDKLAGLESGADDYVVKPFSPRELVARVRAVLNRTMPRPTEAADTMTFGELTIDTASHTVRVSGEEVALTPKEFDLLVFLASNKGIALSREKILQKVWNYDYFGEDRTVDTHVKMLRGHLGKCRSYIATVWGIGYKFDPDAAR